ncbi:MAG: tetratricopeptide repeat protein [Candidatus Hydrogenedentota bacterium]
MKRIIFYFLLILFGYRNLVSANNEALFENANKLYKEDRFNEALLLYLELIDKGITNVDLYYNLANTYYRINDSGYAIYWWKKALKLRPNNEDIKHNLRIAEKKILDEFIYTEDIVETLQKNISSKITIYQSQIMFLSLFLIFFIYLGIMRLRRVKRRRIYRRVRNFIFVLLVISSALCIWRIWYEENYVYGVILVESVNAVSEPKGDASVISIIHKGLTLRVFGIKDDFYQVLLPGNILCYLKKDSLGII